LLADENLDFAAMENPGACERWLASQPVFAYSRARSVWEVAVTARPQASRWLG